jgi:hypothetical protein
MFCASSFPPCQGWSPQLTNPATAVSETNIAVENPRKTLGNIKSPFAVFPLGVMFHVWQVLRERRSGELYRKQTA